MGSWRMIETGDGDSVRNMAIDWALLELRGEGSIPDIIRFYSWRDMAVSLGYSQDIDQELDLELCRQFRVETVFRPTGGALVLHGGDLTYSVVSGMKGTNPAEWAAFGWRIGCVICKGLSRIGFQPTCVTDGYGGRMMNRGACFSTLSRHEIVVKGRKITGNARRWRSGALLQHGSIPLRRISLSVVDLMKGLSPRERLARRAELDGHSTSVGEEAGRAVTYEELWPILLGAFRDEFGEVGDGDSLREVICARAEACVERVLKGPAYRKGIRDARVGRVKSAAGVEGGR